MLCMTATSQQRLRQTATLTRRVAGRYMKMSDEIRGYYEWPQTTALGC
jgi:hypothetical protein